MPNEKTTRATISALEETCDEQIDTIAELQKKIETLTDDIEAKQAAFNELKDEHMELNTKATDAWRTLDEAIKWR